MTSSEADYIVDNSRENESADIPVIKWCPENPYITNPIKMLNLADTLFNEKQLRLQADRLIKRNREDSELTETYKVARDKLLKPNSRLLFELMRVPPLSVNTETIKEIEEKCKNISIPGKSPVPSSININTVNIGKSLLKGLSARDVKFPEHEARFANNFDKFEYDPLINIVFSQRKERGPYGEQ